MQPLLSIIIPTKNRYSTLLPVLTSLLYYIDGKDYEIIVQDNSEDNSLFLKSFRLEDNKVVKYYFQNMPLTVSENSSLAIEKSTGKYLLFIGDDDLVSPFIFEVIKLIEKNNLDALIYTRGNYFWPNVKFNKEYGFNFPDTLRIPKNLNLNLEFLNPEIELDNVLKIGAVNLGKLPTLYHGIVKRECMVKVKDKFGSFVPGSSPDMAIAAALSFVVKKYASVNYPVSLFGASKTSAAGLGAQGMHKNELQNVPWLAKNILEKWDSKIPRIWLGQTIYAQSAYEVLTKIESQKEIHYRNLYLNLYANFNDIEKYLSNYISTNFARKDLIKIKLIRKLRSFKSLLPYPILEIFVFLRGDFKSFKKFKNIGGYNNCYPVLHKELLIDENN